MNWNHQQYQPQTQQGALALMVPGRPLSTVWEQLVPNKYTHFVDLETKQFGVSLLDLLPQGMGAGVYYSVGSGTGTWEYIGMLSNEYPSRIFNSPWLLDESIHAQQHQLQSIVIGVSLESMEILQNLTSATAPQVEITRIGRIVHKIAENLSCYLSSFDGVQHNMLPPHLFAIPRTAIDEWMKKLENRLKYDPNYLFKDN